MQITVTLTGLIQLVFFEAFIGTFSKNVIPFCNSLPGAIKGILITV